MALLGTLGGLLAFGKNPRKAFRKVWRELEELDSRVVDAEAGVVAEGSIDTLELADGAVETDKLGDGAVDSSKMNYFLSDEQTGDGTAQSIAHGLEVEPALVLIIPSLVGTDGATITFTKGTANVNVTATTGAKYRVFAMP
jgi:hypothetical protein